VHLFIQYTVFGLVLGAVYGVAASGLVLTYNTSGIFNFAHGAEAMLGAFVYWQMRFGWHWPAPVALLAAIGVFAPFMGWALYEGIMRGLSETSDVTKIVVTVSLMLGMLYLSQWIWTPKAPRSVQLFFGPRSTVHFLGVKLSVHEVLSLLAAATIAVALRVLFYRTRAGTAMRGIVDDRDLLQLNGYNPNRLAAQSWALGAMLAVLAGILVTPISGGALEANSLTLLVISAFSAAVFGRLRSVPRTFLGALVLGLAANYVLAYFPTSWHWTSDFRISLPMIVLFAVLVVLPQDRLRGASVSRTRERFHTPTVRSAWLWGSILVAVVIALRPLLNPSDVGTLTLGLAFGITALSLTLLTGYAGEMNLAALSFGAVGTLVVFHLGQHGHAGGSRTTPAGLVLGILVCAAVGAVVSLPALRLRGLYLALATMAFGVFISDMVLADIGPHRLPLIHTRYSLFTNGSVVIAPPKIGPLDLHNQTTFLVATAALFAGMGIGLVALRNSGYGRRLAAMRDSPLGAATLGQNLVHLKLSVFALSAAIAGLGGILTSAALGSATADSFVIFISLALMMLTVVGGIGYVSGALFGGLVSGVGVGVIATTLNDLSRRHAGVHGLFAVAAHLAVVSPALIGIGLGRNPSGAVSDIVAAYRPLRQAPASLAAGAVAETGLYALARADVLSNWWFVILTGGVLAALGAAARSISQPTAKTPPSELVGVDAPFPAEVVSMLDHRLGLSAQSVAIRVTRPLEPPVLELVGVRAGYGSIEVLHGVDLQIAAGAVVALLGPNGGGKTTTVGVCSGLVAVTSGELRVAGRTVNGASPSQLARLGVCTVPEGRGVFANLTVNENLWLATGSGASRSTVEEAAFTYFPALANKRNRLAGTLSGGEQQMLALARSVGTEPAVLLLDELSMGLAPMVVTRMYDTVAELSARGVSVLVAEQFAQAVLPLASSAAIVIQGRIVRTGSVSDIEGELSATYLGAGAQAPN